MSDFDKCLYINFYNDTVIYAVYHLFSIMILPLWLFLACGVTNAETKVQLITSDLVNHFVNSVCPLPFKRS